MKLKNFDQRVWQLLKMIPKGRVTSYKEIAKSLNSKAYRAVGQACGRNPYAPVVPCHRVVNASGSIGGFSDDLNKKIKLLEGEGITIKDGKIVDFDKRLFKFSTE